MIRITLTAAALALMASAAFAQSAPQTAPSPEMDAYLKARGETYSRAPDAEQNPDEVATTAKLNASIAAGNDAAERSETEAVADYQQSQDRYQAEAARYATAQAQYEADTRAADAARADYERAHATWEGLVRACEASGRRDCRAAEPQY